MASLRHNAPPVPFPRDAASTKGTSRTWHAAGGPCRISRTRRPERRLIRSWLVRRVSVVGNSGSGKSTIARELACSISVPLVELDSIFHQPGWVPLPAEEFRRRVADAVAGDGWVIDGNYSAVQPLVWERADTVIWIDLPRRIVMRQIVWRTLRRVAGHAELWNGNRESWANLFTWDPAESVISWAWHQHGVYRVRYAAAAEDPANAHLRFVRLRNRAEIRRFLASTAVSRPAR
jgi:adenylate kinase family enzyme